jgi:hypothetical protein
MANTFTYLEGTMFFPFIFDSKDKFDRYSVALGLEGDQVKNAKNIGLVVKQDDGKMDGMAYVQLKSNYRPLLFDAEGNDYSGPTMLSNGSKAVIKVSQRPYNNSFGTGITTFMNAVKITDPVAFVPEGGGKSFDQVPKAGAVDDLNDEVPF